MYIPTLGDGQLGLLPGISSILSALPDPLGVGKIFGGGGGQQATPPPPPPPPPAPMTFCPPGQIPNPQWASIPVDQRAQAAAAGIQACVASSSPAVAPSAADMKLKREIKKLKRELRARSGAPGAPGMPYGPQGTFAAQMGPGGYGCPPGYQLARDAMGRVVCAPAALLQQQPGFPGGLPPSAAASAAARSRRERETRGRSRSRGHLRGGLGFAYPMDYLQQLHTIDRLQHEINRSAGGAPRMPYGGLETGPRIPMWMAYRVPPVWDRSRTSHRQTIGYAPGANANPMMVRMAARASAIAQGAGMGLGYAFGGR